MTAVGPFGAEPARTEQVRVRVRLTGAEVRLRPHEAGVLYGDHLPQVRDDDTLTLTLEFTQNYYGDVVTKLEALASLLEDERLAGAAVTFEEFRHGHNLLRRAYRAAERLRRGRAG